jgi:signal transduction histidine kinase
MHDKEELKALREENERLKRVIATKAEMVSINVHQIRTLLSAVKWIIKMFLDGDLGKLTTEQDSLLRKAYEGNERMLVTASEMLLINKTESIVEKPYVFENVNIVDIIENSIFDFSGEVNVKGIEIIFIKSKEGTSFIRADKEKIRIVFQNLLENAVKYSNNHSKIFISTRQKDGFIEVSVKDTGIGIASVGKEKIFDRFFRGENAQKKEAIGSGIGLFTTKKIIEEHKGKIWFESTENQGSTFFFTIPVWQGK